MFVKLASFCTLFYFIFLSIFHQSNAPSSPFKVSVRLLVYAKEEHIFWDLNKGTLHEESVPALIRNGDIQIQADQTVREAIDEAVSAFCKQLLAEDGVVYQIMAIFEDKLLNMQIQREMDVEPNAEYTAILLVKNERKTFGNF